MAEPPNSSIFSIKSFFLWWRNVVFYLTKIPHCGLLINHIIIQFKCSGGRGLPWTAKSSSIFARDLTKHKSYEQGWRSVPPSAERQIFFLVSKIPENRKRRKPCWTIKKCSPEQKAHCPAWEFKAGKLCWFINGTICEGSVQKSRNEKMKICRSCEVFDTYFNVKTRSFSPA